MQYESERIEYKSQMIDDIYKEVIAFANTDGGVIYIGIDDKGNLTGIDNVDETYTRLTNGIRDAIAPDVTMFVRYILQDNKVIQIEVGEGSYKPYYLKSKGMKPNGIYVRQGASSVQASPAQIRKMIKDSDGDVFEEMRAPSRSCPLRRQSVPSCGIRLISLKKSILPSACETSTTTSTPIWLCFCQTNASTRPKLPCLVMKRILPLKTQRSLAVPSSNSWMTAIRI